MSSPPSTAPLTAARELFAAVRRHAPVAHLTAADWAGVAGDCQVAIRVLEATQTLALARVAATDDVDSADGTVIEEVIGLGHQRLDAPALVSEQLAQTDAGAGRRVAAAVDLVTRLPRLLEAMAAGDLDLYRATRVADELAECPAEVCDEVLDRVGPQHLAAEPAGPLGRRVRRALAAVNSDLLKQRRIRALSDTGLTRSVDADGVDTWIARMPLEQSAQLWDVIDERAQTLRAKAAQGAFEGGGATEVGESCAGQTGAARPRRMPLPAARLAALTELLMGNITGTFHLHLGVPMSFFDPEYGSNPPSGPVPPPDDCSGPIAPPGPVQPPDDSSVLGGGPARRPLPTPNPPGDADDLVPVTGFGTAETVHLRRAFLEHLLSGPGRPDTSGHLRQTPARFTVTRDIIGCHDETGAYLTGPTDVRHWTESTVVPSAPSTAAYRPTTALRRLLTARDARCRFPACQATARFTDIDHVQPWPNGPTALGCLALLCRRHHRVKQRRRWQVTIRPDATLVWTTPLGQSRTTTPVDHLEPLRGLSTAHRVGAKNSSVTPSSPFGDRTLPPAPPTALGAPLPPRPRPSTGRPARGDFDWVGRMCAHSGRPGTVRHPVTITHAELILAMDRREAAGEARRGALRAEQRAAEEAARDAQPPPF